MIEQIEIKVKSIFEENLQEFDYKKFEFDLKQDQFEGWDSFSHMALVSKVEEEFNINLEMDEIVELDSPRKFVQLINKKLNEK